MKNQIAQALILEAKKILEKESFDIGHDLSHHYKVWDNAIQIVLLENILNKVDLDLLTIACWWHDVDRGNKDNTKKFEKAANEFELSELQIKKIIEIINSHSFHDARSNLTEAKVLFDADKIEYINPARWILINNSPEFPIEAGIKYCEAVNTRILKVYEQIYFSTSKKWLTSHANNILRLKPMLKTAYVEAFDWEIIEKLSKADE